MAVAVLRPELLLGDASYAALDDIQELYGKDYIEDLGHNPQLVAQRLRQRWDAQQWEARHPEVRHAQPE